MYLQVNSYNNIKNTTSVHNLLLWNIFNLCGIYNLSKIIMYFYSLSVFEIPECITIFQW